MGDGIKRMSPKEFVDLGYLQEANRLFFHQRGLAMEVYAAGPDDPPDEEYCVVPKELLERIATYSEQDDDIETIQKAIDEAQPVVFGGVWDYRDDPEGVIFGYDPETGSLNIAKSIEPSEESRRHNEAREKLFGSTVQPLWDPDRRKLSGGCPPQTTDEET